MNSIGIFILSGLSLLQLSLGNNQLVNLTHDQLASKSSIPAIQKVGFTPDQYTASPQSNTSTPYQTSAKAAMIYDVSSGKTLYQNNANQSLPIASLTKLMTALVILQKHHPDEVVTIPNDLPPLTPVDQKIGVTSGEQFRLSELMQALLVYSANDVANSLAIWDSGSVSAFVEKMNAMAKTWELHSSTFRNPSGLDELGHVSSAHDLQIMSSILLHDASFRSIINTQKTTIHSMTGKPYLLTSTNKDLSIPYVFGIKTGMTDNAGQSLVLLGRKDGHEIITVVLNSSDRFQESKNMVDWAFRNNIWK